MVYKVSIQVGASAIHGHSLLLKVADHSIEPFTYFIFFFVHVVVISLSVLGIAITTIVFIQAIRSLSCSACRCLMMHIPSPSQNQMQCALFAHAIICNRAPVLELSASEDQSLIFHGYLCPVYDFGFDVLMASTAVSQPTVPTAPQATTTLRLHIHGHVNW
jgi:hypothetical protein